MYSNNSSPSKTPKDADDYDFNYSIDAPVSTTVPGTSAGYSFGAKMAPAGTFKPTPGAVGGGGGGIGLGTSAGRMGTSGGGIMGESRPMTSVSGAGFNSKGDKSKAFDPLNQSKGAAQPLAEKSDNSPEDLAKEMEKGVHKLIEESATLLANGNLESSLEKAKEAGKKERALTKHRTATSQTETLNTDLTYAVWFNLAITYEANDLTDEALNTYTLIVKNKAYPSGGRLRVNMGNLYFNRGKYSLAIKMYRMALDQIPNTGKDLRFKIFRNIGTSFLRLGQFQDAIQSYETIMTTSPDVQSGFNLVLCYYALGDSDKIKRGFVKLLGVGSSDGDGDGENDEDDDGDAKVDDDEVISGSVHVDALKEENKRLAKEAANYILTAARLIAPIIDKNDWTVGYAWVVDALKSNNFTSLSSTMIIEQSLSYLKDKNFPRAIELLKSFEKKGHSLKGMASTNLSFIYFLEGDYATADKYADLAVRNSRYNSKALVNKGNTLFMSQHYGRAKELYLEAIGVSASCVEGIYNLGLTNVRLNLLDEAKQAFEKLHTIIPNNPAVIWQIANLFEQQGMNQQAAKWFNVLITRVPTDPGVLSRLGQIFSKENEESQGFHYQLESYRHYPVNLDVISWLGVWFVKHEMYEKSIHYFTRASQIQPSEVKWRLMVTSCYRRMGNYSKALQLYESIHEEYQDNVECLRYLVAICKDLGRPFEEYQGKLIKLDRVNAAKVQSGTAPSGALTQIGGGGKGGGGRGAVGGGGGGGGSPLRGGGGGGEQAHPSAFFGKSLAAPSAKGVDRGGFDSKEREEEDFADADVNDLLV